MAPEYFKASLCLASRFEDARYRIVVSEPGTALESCMPVPIGKDRPFTDMFVGRQNGDVSVHA